MNRRNRHDREDEIGLIINRDQIPSFFLPVFLSPIFLPLLSLSPFLLSLLLIFVPTSDRRIPVTAILALRIRHTSSPAQNIPHREALELSNLFLSALSR
jgi:hypothetical protein